jgi:succinate-semialdehyde dehydrogenase/glutarate-semialdehyde dehydrogenase
MSISFDPTPLHTDLFLDGAWQKATSSATFPVENPATNEIIAHVADGGPEDAALAIEAAGRAQTAWATSTPRERADILRRAFELVIANTDRLAAIMTAEMGKPLAEARGEVANGAEMLRWFSEEAVRIGGDHGTSVDGNTRIMITKNRSVRACWSRRGTSLWPWAPARSRLPSLLAAPWSSSRRL